MAKRSKRNKKHLVIVESPAKARTLAGILGPDYDIRASVGHVRDLPKSKLGVDTENDFAPRYLIPKEKKAVVQEIRKAAEDADEIYLATDPDREGEAISWHLIEAAELGDRPHQRVVFHEITPEAVREAFQHPRPIDYHLVDAQQARRVLDRLVGYKISPVLWKKIEIPNQAEADRLVALLRSARHTVADLKEKPQTRRPGPPFITSTLQQDASRRFGFSAKRTMAVAQ